MTDLEFLESTGTYIPKCVVYEYDTGLLNPEVRKKLINSGTFLSEPNPTSLMFSLQSPSLFGSQTFVVDLDGLAGQSKKASKAFGEMFELAGTEAQRNTWLILIRASGKLGQKWIEEKGFKDARKRSFHLIEAKPSGADFEGAFQFLCKANRPLLGGGTIENWDEFQRVLQTYVKQAKCDLCQLNNLLAVTLTTCVDTESGKFDGMRFKQLYGFAGNQDFMLFPKLLGGYLMNPSAHKRALFIRELGQMIKGGQQEKALMVRIFNTMLDLFQVNVSLLKDRNKAPMDWSYYKFSRLKFFNQIAMSTLLKFSLLMMREDTRLCTTKTFLCDVDRLLRVLER